MYTQTPTDGRTHSGALFLAICYILEQKHPGGWETALAAKHLLKKNSSGAVAPYAFLDQHYLEFSPGKLSDFEGMMWYLQGFVLLGWCSLFTSALDVSLLQAFA